MKRVYLCGPITGLHFDEAKDWRDSSSEFVQRLVALGWKPLSPMRNKEKFRTSEPLSAFFDEGADAVHQDLVDIDNSQVVIVNVLGAKRVSLGSMAEMGYAYARGVPIILVSEGEENVHHHVFPQYMATIVVDNLVDALEELVTYPRDPVPYAPPLPRPAPHITEGVIRNAAEIRQGDPDFHQP